jgi:septal ring factor EnvC (AmiA/AmiB activator)
MKFLTTFLLISTLSTQVMSQTEATVLESETINVDGYVKEQKVADPELEQLRGEIQKQKKEIVLNKEKAKKFQELSKSVEKLSETTEEYLEEKRAAQEQIAEYNTKVKCLQATAPGPECDKYVRRK